MDAACAGLADIHRNSTYFHQESDITLLRVSCRTIIIICFVEILDIGLKFASLNN